MDYSKPITRDDIDIDRYTAKIERVDKWLSREDKESKDALLEYGKFMWDTTTFAYLHFKIDGMKAQLYPYQDLMANDKHRFKYFRAANQIGKSLFLDIITEPISNTLLDSIPASYEINDL